MFFNNIVLLQQNEQLKALKDHLDEEIVFHQGQIKNHNDAITAHQARIEELNKKKSQWSWSS